MHGIINKLSKLQATQILNWVNNRVQNNESITRFSPSNIPLTNEEEKGDYTRFLLHLIVEHDKEDIIGLTKLLEKNESKFERERQNEQSTRGDFIDLLALLVSIMSWLQLGIAKKEEKKVLINHFHFHLNNDDKGQLLVEMPEELFNVLKNASVINKDNSVSINGNNDIVYCKSKKKLWVTKESIESSKKRLVLSYYDMCKNKYPDADDDEIIKITCSMWSFFKPEEVKEFIKNR